jgi:hypothetical protein
MVGLRGRLAITIPPASMACRACCEALQRGIARAKAFALSAAAIAGAPAGSRCRGDSPAPARRSARASRDRDQQRADARRPAELVRRDGDEVGVRQRQLAGTLRAVGQQQRSGARDPLRNLVDRLDHAGFIVDLLDGDQRRPAGSASSSAPRSISRRHRPGELRAPPSPPAPHHARSRRAARRHLRARGDRDRLARAGGEDDVMPPAERIGDRRARLLERRARRAPVGMRRARVGPALAAPRPSRRAPRAAPASSPHGRDRGGRLRQKPWIPADCQLNARPYIGAAAAAHPSACRSQASTQPCPKSFSPVPKAASKAVSIPGLRPRAPVALILHSTRRPAAR